jgi:hypothetical protein
VLDVDGGGRALDALRPADIDPLIVSSKIKTGALPARTMEPEMADAQTRLVALEEAFYVLVRALEEKKILEPGAVTKRLHQMEETLRDSRATALADAIQEVRRNLD